MNTVSSAINKIFREKSALLGDVYSCVYANGERREGFKHYSNMFCDNVVFWCIANKSPGKEKKLKKEIGRYVSKLRLQFQVFGFKDYDVKFITTGLLLNQPDDDIFPYDVVEKYCAKKRISVEHAGYITVKVGLSENRGKTVLHKLRRHMHILQEDNIYMHDIDMTVDCTRITTRQIVEAYLRKTEADVEIVKDRHSVGDNCISWFSFTGQGQKIRTKVYNKFVQMLESAEARKALGSRMEDLVANSNDEFTRKLLNGKEQGYTRVEVTFYGPDLLQRWEYKLILSETKEFLSECPTYKTSYVKQWTTLAKKIRSVVAIYIPEHKTFAYCHWYNSLTKKKYGYEKRGISQKEVMTLLANYGFNDRRIYFYTANVGEGGYDVTSQQIFQRAPNSTAMTLVPGGNKGLYPSKKSYGKDVLDFTDVGIVTVDAIVIGWPKKRLNKSSPALAEIYEIMEDDHLDDNIMRCIRITHTSSYRAGHTILLPGHLYYATCYGVKAFRGTSRIFLITKCGLHITCGKSLEAVFCDWSRRFSDGNNGIKNRECFTFAAVRFVTIRGRRDIICELVDEN